MPHIFLNSGDGGGGWNGHGHGLCDHDHGCHEDGSDIFSGEILTM